MLDTPSWNFRNLRIKRKILNASREERQTSNQNLNPDFSKASYFLITILISIKQWNIIFKLLLKNVLNLNEYIQPNHILVERQKIFSDKQWFRFTPNKSLKNIAWECDSVTEEKRSKIGKCDLTNSWKLTRRIKLLFAAN